MNDKKVIVVVLVLMMLLYFLFVLILGEYNTDNWSLTQGIIWIVLEYIIAIVGICKSIKIARKESKQNAEIN